MPELPLSASLRAGLLWAGLIISPASMVGCASLNQQPGLEPQATVAFVLDGVCLPYVLDNTSLEDVSRGAGLQRSGWLPDPFSPVSGTRFRSVGPGQRSLTLNDGKSIRTPAYFGLRSCSLYLEPMSRSALEGAVDAVVASRGAALSRAARLNTGEEVKVHACGLRPKPVVVSVAHYGNGQHAVFVSRRPEPPPECSLPPS